MPEQPPLCQMCRERPAHPKGRPYRSPRDAELGTPVEYLPRMCMECTSDSFDDGF